MMINCQWEAGRVMATNDSQLRALIVLYHHNAMLRQTVQLPKRMDLSLQQKRLVP